MFQAKKNTGYRGVRWFGKDEYGVGYTLPAPDQEEFEVHTWSCGSRLPEKGNDPDGFPKYVVGACLLHNERAIRWLEVWPKLVYEGPVEGGRVRYKIEYESVPIPA